MLRENRDGVQAIRSRIVAAAASLRLQLINESVTVGGPPCYTPPMTVHTVMMPYRIRGRELRSVIWDDQAGTVEGDQWDVPRLQEPLAGQLFHSRGQLTRMLLCAMQFNLPPEAIRSKARTTTLHAFAGLRCQTTSGVVHLEAAVRSRPHGFDVHSPSFPSTGSSSSKATRTGAGSGHPLSVPLSTVHGRHSAKSI